MILTLVDQCELFDVLLFRVHFALFPSAPCYHYEFYETHAPGKNTVFKVGTPVPEIFFM